MEYFERPAGGEGAILVHLDLRQGGQDEDLDEFRLLASSAEVAVLAVVTGSRQRPDARLYAGTGKVAEIRDAIAATGAEVVLFNHALTPAQERNLERELQCRVLDRTGLILDIFAQRARTHEGKLQVELAQLDHLSSRLVRGWTHLERQKGGIGLRGPGETQLETDRRLLRKRIDYLKARLEKVRQTRSQGRAARQKAGVPTVSLVGYTNAGKSTLFNRLAGADVYAADQLFATLDPTLRRVSLDGIGPVVLADTVGFVRHLPHQLVDAFRATLEETVQADLLLHVVDAGHPERDLHEQAVRQVLQEVGATAPVLMVYNKLDTLPDQQPRIDHDEWGVPVGVWISARDGRGFAELLQAMQATLASPWEEAWLSLPAALARLRARLYSLGAVLEECPDDQGGGLLRVRMLTQDLGQCLAREGLTRADVLWDEKAAAMHSHPATE
ncbi:ribosome rescue GTPase HflX [Perlucidibaca piscinae]|uniref:ribosome rescue GTPase HflX n=1 Tax=Perlucidibaca piscinae TaxID=392589 RepID=UPI0003B4B3D4|nr:ribosome rescue GTPase HflX [Perlucidibaca piscinae]